MKAIKFCALTAMIGLFPAQAALAQELAPRLSGAISVEVQNDLTHDSDDPDLEKNTLFTKIEPYFMLSLTDRIAVEAALVMEPVTETEAGKDTAFDNEGAFVEELKLSYTGDDFYLYAGKYNPTFGIAWDLAPGIYGRKFAEDYEITERIGFGGSYTAI